MKTIAKTSLFLTLIFFTLTACFTSQPTGSAAADRAASNRVLPDVQFYADLNQDGALELVQLDPKPAPRQGTQQWAIDFYSSIRYPAPARENGIQGIVVLDVLVDELGTVREVEIKKSLYQACDEEAKRAFWASTQPGYSPAIVNGETVPFRMDVPVGFWLE